MAGFNDGGKKSFLNRFIPSKQDKKSEIIRKIVVLIALATFITSILILANYYVGIERTKRLNRELESLHETFSVITPMTTTTPPTEATTVTTEPPPLVVLDSMKALLDENPDTAGWIKVDNTNVNNVVVQVKDNDYYLEHDYYGNTSKAGTVFADFRCIVNDYNEKQSDNIVIYGHNQADGTMFGTLKKYKIKHSSTNNFQFYLDNPSFEFSNLYEDYTYKIVGLFIIEVLPEQTRDGIIFDYHNFLRFKAPERSFDTFKENVLLRTAVNTGVDFVEGDKFVTLSTCSNEFEPSRFVVIGRRVREGEDPNVDTSLAVLNTSAVEPDIDYIFSR